jgi:formylglycine-generating enzyme required for sulfatase activity
MIEIPAGMATLGRTRDRFGWDNEFDEHTIYVPAFRITKYKVTNGEYLAFVREGAGAPHFWSRDGDRWMYRGMFETIPLPLDWPVYVTQEQAAAYARWRGRALPTEAQFHRAAYAGAEEIEREFPWGNTFESAPVYDFARWDPAPVTATPENDSALGVSQLVGNGWEWTSTVFAPFPGFEPFPFYPGYSRDFFDGAHYVIKGASPRTARRFLRRSFRNWFRPNYPYVYATFRLVEN